MTYDPEQQFTSDVLFEVPPDPMHGREAASGPWQGVERLPLGAFRPAGRRSAVRAGRLCGRVARAGGEAAAALALIDLGERLGKAAAADAQAAAALSGVKLPGQPAATPAAAGDVRESLAGVRPTQKDCRPSSRMAERCRCWADTTWW